MIKVIMKGGKDSILFGTNDDQGSIKQLIKAWNEGKAASFTVTEGDIVKAAILYSEIAAIVIASPSDTES